VVTRREANVFACLAATVLAPGGRLPPLARTDPEAFVERYLAASPRLNRIVLRALLYGLEIGPRLFGYGARMRRLPPERRLAYLDAVARSPAGLALQGLEVMTKLGYYGDDEVMRALGYDPDDVVARAKEIRLAEARW
jgi:hypothetical protein